MREISFRAYNTRTNTYFGITFSIYKVNMIDIEDACDWIFLQYTGMIDKNGTRIYEGDIVLSPEWEDYDKGIMGQVKREIRWSNCDALFGAYLKDETERNGQMLDNACNMEVIGNIYENS